MNKKETFSKLYANRQNVLEHPEEYTEVVTEFLSGGLGACVYRQEIKAAEIVGCWQFKEYRIACPTCGEMAYITLWAGSINSGGYWEIQAYCPHCDALHQYHKYTKPIAWHDTNWTTMRDIVQEVKAALESRAEWKMVLLEHDNAMLKKRISRLERCLESERKDRELQTKAMHIALLNAYFNGNRDVLKEWYIEYCQSKKEKERQISEMEQQKKELRQQLRAGIIDHLFYQKQLTPLKKKISEVESQMRCMVYDTLTPVFPDFFDFLSDKEVVAFLNEKFGSLMG